VRPVDCRRCGKVKRERLDFLADNAHFTKRFAFYVGRRCQQASIRDVANELKLDWDTAKTLEMQYMRAQLERAGTPAPQAIGIDEIAVRKATATASWSAILFASGRSGSAARIVPRPAWRRSTIGWGARKPAKSG
jgi:transposase